MVGRREQNRLETRARVLEAAKTLFPERGVEGTTAADLAAAARISRATFFNHFGSKEELLVALYEDQVGNLETLVTEQLARPIPTEERIRLLFADLVESLDERPGYLEVVAFELERASSRETTAVRTTRFHEQLRRILDAGLELGDVRTDHDPWLMVEMIGAAYVSLLRNLWLLPDYDVHARASEAGRFLAGAVCRS